MKPISWGAGGAQTFDLTFPKVSDRQGTPVRELFLQGNPGYYSSLMLLIMHAEGFHCPSCPTNCGMRICHRLLDAAWKKRSNFHLYSWQVLDPNDFLGRRVDLHDKTCFITRAVCGNCCLSAAHFPTLKIYTLIYFLLVSRKIPWNTFT